MEPNQEELLISLRRELHKYPEPGWCEYYTTSRLVDELERIGVDEYYVGEEVISAEDRLAVPSEDVQDKWFSKAKERGAREEVLEKTKGAMTGAVAVLKQGDGPTIGMRVDIDALRITESENEDHKPASKGFRSENEGTMHACGHDSHMTIGIGVLEAVKESDFEGTFKLLLQPAEEEIGGGKPMSKSEHIDDIDFFIAIHIGLDHPTGEVVAGVEDFLAVNHFDLTFEGQSSHAGGHPELGKNAVQAMATAVENFYGIPRHTDGATRVNAGKIEAGTARNIIPEFAEIEGELRGETTELMTYMRNKVDRIVESAADMHECTYSMETVGEAPSAISDEELVDTIFEVIQDHPQVDNPLRNASLGGSEDATYIMEAVQDQGGLATFVGIGTDHPTGHHTPTFDIDEASIPIAVDVLTDSILAIANN